MGTSTEGATLVSLLEKWAVASPERPFIVMDGEDSRTYGRFNADANRLAHGLAGLGVGRGDHVAVMLENRLEALLVTFALRKLAAVEIPVHTSTRGESLLHVLRTATPKLVVLEDDLVDRLEEPGDELRPFDLVVLGETERAERAHPLRRVTPFDAVVADDEANPGIAFHDTHVDAVVFTSGTTGPAKGCVLPHRAGATMGMVIAKALRFRESDCLYCPYPTSHFDSRYLTVAPALWTGCRAAIGRGFDPISFWDEVRDLGVTVFDFLGPALTQLWERDEDPSDADNPVRLAWGGSIPTFGPLFEERFGLRLCSGYGLTDAGVVALRDPELRGEPWGSNGRVVEPYEIRIGDSHDDPVPTGDVGEILIRSRDANVTMKGYLGMPKATAAAFRNMWLHTGDLARMDADGRLYFEDRKSESIRRRGRNIPSWEVEQALEAHPDVLEAVAIAMPGEPGEDDVCAVVVLREGADLTEAAVRDFLAPRIADFMLPRKLRVVDVIPRTDTGKPEKHRLADGQI